jgi:predicted transcriptional regulator
MTVRELVERLDMTVRAGSAGLDGVVSGGYASDLLSDVMANAREGSVWITLHRHPNVVAVAVNGGLAAVVLVNGREPEEATREKADEEGIPLVVSPLPTFELVGRMHRAGIHGQSRS